MGLKYDRAMVVFTSFFTPEVSFSFTLLILFFYFAYKSFKGNKVIFFGTCWFFIALFPVSGVIPINGFVMEHWLYLPSIGFLVVFSYFMVKLNQKIYLLRLKNRCFYIRLYIPLLLIIAIIFSYLTLKRNKDWLNPVIFYNKILEHNPLVGRVRNNLAMAYSDKGMLDEAEREYKMAIELEDMYAETHHNLGQLYLRKGRLKEAIGEFKKAILINVDFIYSHLALKELYDKLGMTKEAQEESIKINAILAKWK
jgi:tetratricopeptide (TPR) repeat protein